MTNMDQKTDELKSYIGEYICSWVKNQKKHAEMFSKIFDNNLSYNSQMDYKYKLKEQRSQNITKAYFKIRFQKLKYKTWRTNKKSKTWNNTNENCASGLKELQQRTMKPVTKFQKDYRNLQRISCRDS